MRIDNLAPGFMFDAGFVDGLLRFTALNNGIFVGEDLPGDTNADGVVDLVDFNNVRNHFGEAGGLGDTNADSAIDLEDLNAVKNNFGATLESLPAPEPSTRLLAVCGIAAICLRLSVFHRSSI